MSRTPTISILIPNYNHANLIGQQLDSLVTQSFPPDEIIVIDDGSTDNSVEVIEAYSKRYPIIRFYRNSRNHGVVYTVNKALQLAKSDYISFQSADDFTLPGFIEKYVHFLSQHPTVGLCCSDPSQMNEETGQIEESHLGLSRESIHIPPQKLVGLLKKRYFNIAGHTAILRRTAVLEAGSMLSELRWYCDWFVYYVVSFRHGIAYLPKSLAIFRISKNSYSAQANHLNEEKKSALTHLLRHLHSPQFKDVLPSFKESSVFSIFGSAILSVIQSHPEYRDLLTPTLIRRSLWQECRYKLRPFLPLALKKIYRRLRQAYETRTV